MKNLTKLFALVAITALAAISCAPEVEVSGYDWVINQQINPELNSAQYGTGNSLPTGVAVTKVKDVQTYNANATPSPVTTMTYSDIEVTVTFGSRADVLRESNANIETKLKEFLTFKTVNRADPSVTPTDGAPDSFSADIGYVFVKRAGTAITVRLDTTYTTQSPAPNPPPVPKSPIVAKIDGTKFTYAHGLKVDYDNNGIPGEAGYDDRYYTATGGSYGAGSYPSITFPIAYTWYFSISNTDLSNYASWATATSKTSDAILSIPAVTYSGSGNTTIDDGIKQTFAGYFKLQKYDGASWVAAGTALLNTSSKVIEFTNITLDHLVPYRIVYEGNAEDPTSSTEIYGLKQRLTIQGPDYNATDRAYWRGQKFIAGDISVPYNSDILDFDRNDVAGVSGPNGFNLTAYSFTPDNKNVVLEFDAGVVAKQNATVTTQTDYYDLKRLGLEEFKKSFRIVHHATHSQTNVFTQDLIEVEIKNIEYVQKHVTDQPYDATKTQYDIIRITLDPNYTKSNNYTYVLINNGLGYADNINVFGSADSYFYDFFDVYECFGF